MENVYKITFRKTDSLDFKRGSLVTYKNHELFSYIKEGLYSSSDFFYIEDINWHSYTCKISNGVDSIRTSPDQLIGYISYLEKKVNNKIVESYILEDQKLGIYLDGLKITRNNFLVFTSRDSTKESRIYKSARVIEDKIPEMF
jgi:hypothetical protein